MIKMGQECQEMTVWHNLCCIGFEGREIIESERSTSDVDDGYLRVSIKTVR